DLAQHEINGPAVLFDDIKGYSSGYRILSNTLGSATRTALLLQLPTGKSWKELLPIWRAHSKEIPQSIPPVEVKDGPILENIVSKSNVDLSIFPTPKWHELDGGRYIGTGTVDIIKDPDSPWVNLGCYRVSVVDRKRVTLYISPGKHGRVLREKYFAKGEAMPVVLVFGQDPAVFMAASLEVPWGTSELEYAGALKGEAIPVVRGRATGLPIPATAEIAVEGFIKPGETAPEGPFGEWTGYYASAQRGEPVMEVENLYYRNDPIIVGTPPYKPPAEFTAYRGLLRSALLWGQLEQAGVPDVTGVWCHEAGGARLFVAVSIKARYPGHSKQAAHVAAMCHAGAYLGRSVVVVDDDIDVTDMHDVIWAMGTRCDPDRDTDLIRRAWSGPLDPAIDPGNKFFNSRMIFDATRPWEWREKFPPVVEPSLETRSQVVKKWGEFILGAAQGPFLTAKKSSTKKGQKKMAARRATPRKRKRRK
ncbi:MAG: UbiD family decarboxylase, partial [Candidatus Binatia bacterium]|nr:UbiD family decarboxylase [Candidatus Binatia bacterium]